MTPVEFFGDEECEQKEETGDMGGMEEMTESQANYSEYCENFYDAIHAIKGTESIVQNMDGDSYKWENDELYFRFLGNQNWHECTPEGRFRIVTPKKRIEIISEPHQVFPIAALDLINRGTCRVTIEEL